MHERIMNKRMKAIEEQQNEMLRKHGWVVHYVFETGANEFNGLANIHTHGMAENLGHPDIQVVLPMAPETIHPILHTIADDIKQGRVFEPNVRTPRVLRGMDVMFISVQEEGRELLRLLIPDPNGKLPMEEGCEDMYNRQLEELPK